MSEFRLFPKSEEFLIGGSGSFGIPLQRVCACEAQVGEDEERIIRDHCEATAGSKPWQCDKVGRLTTGKFGSWFGRAPDDYPLLARDISTEEIYALEMDWP